MESTESYRSPTGSRRVVTMGDLEEYCDATGGHLVLKEGGPSMLTCGGRTVTPRRASLILSGQDLESGRHVKPTCGEKRCILPEHLSYARPLGTPAHYVCTGKRRGPQPGGWRKGQKLSKELAGSIRNLWNARAAPQEALTVLHQMGVDVSVEELNVICPLSYRDVETLLSRISAGVSYEWVRQIVLHEAWDL